MRKSKILKTNIFTTKDTRKIYQLLLYWKNLNKQKQLYLDDYITFNKKSDESFLLFVKYYPRIQDSFIRRGYLMSGLLSTKDAISKIKSTHTVLSNNEYIRMKDWSKKFITRFNKYFELALFKEIQRRSEIEDSRDILYESTKLTYKWASGIIISNYIASIMMRLIKRTTGLRRVQTDDISTLYELLRSKTKNSKLKNFLKRSYRRFEDADKLRNRCAHIDEGEPTKQEIEQSISLAQLLKKYL